MDAIFQELYTIIHNMVYWLYAFGGLCFIISLVLAGLRRMPIFGSTERSTLLSNAALYAAISGLVLMLIAIPIASAFSAIFPNHPPLTPPTPVPTTTPTSGTGTGF